MQIRVLLTLAALAGSTLPERGYAQARSPFDGSWVADLDTQSGLPTDVYLIRDGHYSCTSCEPPRAYPADGELRPVPGDPDRTSEAVRISSPSEIVTHIVGSALDRTTTMTVAPDGRTATYVSIDHRPGIAAAIRTEYIARKTGPTLSKAHIASGTWKGVRYVAVPEELRTTTMQVVGNKLMYSTPLGTSFTATFGGDFVPVRSAHAADVQVAVRRTAPSQIQERVRQKGKEVLVRVFTVRPDGRSMETASTDLTQGTTFRVTSRLKP